jgi:DNA-directed RNA polymerase subunit RPC12/RpoP
MSDRPPPDRTACRSCGRSFAFDPGFYSERGLTPPMRCPHCRALRRGRLVQAEGVISVPSRATGYVFVRTAEGGRFFVSPCRGFVAGQRVRFRFDPTEARPIARHVEPLTELLAPQLVRSAPASSSRWIRRSSRARGVTASPGGLGFTWG